MATEIRNGVVYEISAENKTGPVVDEAVKTAEEGAKKVGEASNKAGIAAVKGFSPLKAAMSALRGDFAGCAAEVAKIIPAFQKLGSAGPAALGAVSAAVVSVINFASALKDLISTAFNLGGAPQELREAAAAMNSLNNEAEIFAVKMNEAKEASERQTKNLMDQADAVAAMTRAQNEYNRQLEIAAANTPEERAAAGRKYDTIDAEASEAAAAEKRNIQRGQLAEEERRLREEIREAKRMQKAGRDMIGQERTTVYGTDLYWEQTEKLEELQKKLEENRHSAEMLDNEEEAASVQHDARLLREANAERERIEGEKAKADEEARREEMEAAREAAEYQRELDRELAEAAREEARAIAEAQKRAEAEVHAQKLRDIAERKSAMAVAIDEQRSAEARLAAAKSQVQQAWGWYRDKDSMAAQLEEEKAEAAAQKQFEKDFEKLSFRRDWRTAKNLSVDQEAVRRVALAKEEESAAQKAVEETAENTRRAADALEFIQSVFGEGGV